MTDPITEAVAVKIYSKIADDARPHDIANAAILATLKAVRERTPAYAVFLDSLIADRERPQ